MQSSRFEQVAPWAGIGFSLLIVVAFVLIVQNIVNPEDPDSTIIDYYNDSTARALWIAGAYLWVLACMLFLGFLVALRFVLSSAEGEPPYLSSLAYTSGLTFVVLMIISIIAIATPAGAISLGGADQTLDPDFMRILPQLGFGLMRIGAAAAAIVMIYCTSFLSLRTEVLPRGTAWAGFVLAPFSLLLLTPIPMVAIPIWVLIISVALLRRTTSRAAIA